MMVLILKINEISILLLSDFSYLIVSVFFLCYNFFIKINKNVSKLLNIIILFDINNFLSMKLFVCLHLNI